MWYKRKHYTCTVGSLTCNLSRWIVFLTGKINSNHRPKILYLLFTFSQDVFISRYKAKVADSKLTMKLKHTIKTCDEAFQALATNYEVSFEINANSLEGVSKGRYTLLLVADYLYKWFIEGDSSFTALNVKREVMAALLESARRLCAEGSTPQMYLLRQLVRRYGFDCVRTLGGYKELEWILPPGIRQEVSEWMTTISSPAIAPSCSE